MRTAENELAELVFERLGEATAAHLTEKILGRRLAPPTSEEGVEEASIPRLEIGSGAVLLNVHLRLLRYEGSVYDVELNFIPGAAECVSRAALMESLHKFATRLGMAHAVESYYAGMEPASDADTRFFTGAEPGPYF